MKKNYTSTNSQVFMRDKDKKEVPIDNYKNERPRNGSTTQTHVHSTKPADSIDNRRIGPWTHA